MRGIIICGGRGVASSLLVEAMLVQTMAEEFNLSNCTVHTEPLIGDLRVMTIIPEPDNVVHEKSNNSDALRRCAEYNKRMQEQVMSKPPIDIARMSATKADANRKDERAPIYRKMEDTISPEYVEACVGAALHQAFNFRTFVDAFLMAGFDEGTAIEMAREEMSKLESDDDEECDLSQEGECGGCCEGSCVSCTDGSECSIGGDECPRGLEQK